jgi:hypothetical protein
VRANRGTSPVSRSLNHVAVREYEQLPWDKRPWVRLSHNGQPASREVRARWRKGGDWVADVVYSLAPPANPEQFRAQRPHDRLTLVEEP